MWKTSIVATILISAVIARPQPDAQYYVHHGYMPYGPIILPSMYHLLLPPPSLRTVIEHKKVTPDFGGERVTDTVDNDNLGMKTMYPKPGVQLITLNMKEAPVEKRPEETDPKLQINPVPAEKQNQAPVEKRPEDKHTAEPKKRPDIFDDASGDRDDWPLPLPVERLQEKPTKKRPEVERLQGAPVEKKPLADGDHGLGLGGNHDFDPPPFLPIQAGKLQELTEKRPLADGDNELGLGGNHDFDPPPFLPDGKLQAAPPKKRPTEDLDGVDILSGSYKRPDIFDNASGDHDDWPPPINPGPDKRLQEKPPKKRPEVLEEKFGDHHDYPPPRKDEPLDPEDTRDLQ